MSNPNGMNTSYEQSTNYDEYSHAPILPESQHVNIIPVSSCIKIDVFFHFVLIIGAVIIHVISPRVRSMQCYASLESDIL